MVGAFNRNNFEDGKVYYNNKLVYDGYAEKGRGIFYKQDGSILKGKFNDQDMQEII